jgi:hypothetical protein
MCTRQPAFTILRLVLPSGGSIDIRAPSFLGCGIDVSRFGVPSLAQQGQVETSPLSVSVKAPRTAASSSILHYTVTVTNTADRPFVLSPCPSYEEYVYIAQPAQTHRSYYLNCDAVSEIPPHRTVTFAMVIDIPEGSGLAKFGWFLNVTGSPAAGTALQVLPST